MFGPLLPQRPPHHRRRPAWWARWQRAWRRHPGRRWLLVAPVLVLALLLAPPAPAALSEQDLARAWELAGRIGVVVVTALIGRAMLNQGR